LKEVSNRDKFYSESTLFRDFAIARTLLGHRGTVDRYQVLARLTSTTLYMLGKRYLCRYHAEIDNIDSAACQSGVCTSIFAPRGCESPNSRVTLLRVAVLKRAHNLKS